MTREQRKKTHFYYLTGDSFLRKRELEKMTRETFGENPEVHLYYPHDFDPLKFIAEAQSFPFFSAAKVLVVKDAEKITVKVKEVILPAFPLIPSVSAVVFESEEISEKDPVYQWVKENGAVVRCSEAPEDFSVRFLREKKRTISRDALELLLERTAGNIRLLQEALEKLSLLASDAPINAEQVLKLSNEGQRFNAFDLVNSFARGERREALKILAYLLEEEDAEPAEIIGAMNWHLKKKWQARSRQGAGERIPEGTGRRLRDAVEELFQLDRAIKTGRVEARKGMETFLIRFG